MRAISSSTNWSSEVSWVLFRFLLWCQLSGSGVVVACDDLFWGFVSRGFVQPAGAPPVDPDHGRPLHVLARAPGLRVGQPGFIRSVHGFSERVVVGVSTRSGRGGGAVTRELLTVGDARVPGAVIGVMHQPVQAVSRSGDGLFQGLRRWCLG